MHRPALSLLLLSFLASGLGRVAITDADEASYAVASREMVESGDWLCWRRVRIAGRADRIPIFCTPA